VAYLVLARKYRPERFSEVVGQEHITRTLTNAITHDRVHHAYMFCGVRGLGKTTVARILAKCLVCEKGPTAEPCNVCEQCVAVKQGRSTDVIEIDAASNNGVDNIRRLREQVHYLPQSARRKVYIVDEVHMLSNQAFNALLKTLEEPPEHVSFFFATTDPHKVLPTILSRVNRLDFRRVSGDALVDHLQHVLTKEGFGAEQAALRMVSRAAEGSVRDALTFLDEIIAFADEPGRITAEEARIILGQADRFSLGELVASILDRDPAATLERFDEVVRTTGHLQNLAVGILQHLRDLAVVKATGQRAALIDVSEPVFEQLTAQAESVDHVRIAQLFDRFARTVEGLETSASPRLTIEMGLLDLAHAEPLQPLGGLVERLTALAGGTSGGGRGGGSGSGKVARGSSGPSRGSGAPGRREASQNRPEPTPAPPIQSAPADEPTRARASATAPEPEAIPRPTARPAPIDATRPNDEARDVRPTAPTSPPSSAPTASRPGSLSDQLWNMVSGSAEAEVERDSPTASDASKGGPTSPRGAAPSPPRESRDAFELAPADRPTPGAARNRHAQVDPDAGCPSSRCEPRDAVPWRTLAPFEAWEALLDRIRDEDELLFAVLGEAGLLHLTPEGIDLAVSRGSFARDQLQSGEIRARIESYLRDFFGEALPLSFTDTVPSLPDVPSYKLVELDRLERHRVEVERRARSHPRIRALVDQFGAQIEHIEPLGDPPRDA